MRLRNTQPQRAPLSLRAKSGVINATLLGLALALYFLFLWLRRDPDKEFTAVFQGQHKTRDRWVRVLGAGMEVCSEQFPTPGQQVMRLRTVDARTGRRVDLWRTLARLGLATSSKMLVRHLMTRGHPSADFEAAQRDMSLEMVALRERYADDDEALNVAAMGLIKKRGAVGSLPLVNLFRRWPVMLALVFLDRRLRRALGRTVVVASPSQDTGSSRLLRRD